MCPRRSGEHPCQGLCSAGNKATLCPGSQLIAAVLQQALQTPLLWRKNAGPTQDKDEKLKGRLGDYFGTME